MAEKSMRCQLKTAAAEWGVDPDDLAKMLGLKDYTLRTLVQRALVEQKVQEARAVTQPIPGGSSNRSRNRQPRVKDEPGTSLVPTSRQRTAEDDAWLLWMEAVVALDRAIRQGDLGDPFRPELFAFGHKFRIVDPFYDLLQGYYTDYDDQFVYIGLEIQQKAQNEGSHYPWRSRRLLATMELGLSSLYCAPLACSSCGEPLSGRLGFDFVKAVLREQILLPDAQFPDAPEGGWDRSAGRSKPKRLMRAYPNTCKICDQLRRGMVQVEVELQNHPGDSQDAVAARTAAIVDLIARVSQELEVGIPEVRVCLKRILERSQSKKKGGRRGSR